MNPSKHKSDVHCLYKLVDAGFSNVYNYILMFLVLIFNDKLIDSDSIFMIDFADGSLILMFNLFLFACVFFGIEWVLY